MFASIASQLLTNTIHSESIWNRFHSLAHHTDGGDGVATMAAETAAATQNPACCSVVASSCSFVAFILYSFRFIFYSAVLSLLLIFFSFV